MPPCIHTCAAQCVSESAPVVRAAGTSQGQFSAKCKDWFGCCGRGGRGRGGGGGDAGSGGFDWRATGRGWLSGLLGSVKGVGSAVGAVLAFFAILWIGAFALYADPLQDLSESSRSKALFSCQIRALLPWLSDLLLMPSHSSPNACIAPS